MIIFVSVWTRLTPGLPARGPPGCPMPRPRLAETLETWPNDEAEPLGRDPRRFVQDRDRDQKNLADC